MHTNAHLARLLVEAHVENLRRDAAGGKPRQAAWGHSAPETATADAEITLRRARPDDAPTLQRLAHLDSNRVPAGDLLIAEADGELRAAISVHGGAIIADPFHRTEALKQLLITRAAQLRAELTPRGRWSRHRLELTSRITRSKPRTT